VARVGCVVKGTAEWQAGKIEGKGMGDWLISTKQPAPGGHQSQPSSAQKGAAAAGTNALLAVPNPPPSIPSFFLPCQSSTGSPRFAPAGTGRPSLPSSLCPEEPVRESAAPFVSAVTATAAEGNLGRGSSHSQFAHPFTIAVAASADLCGE